jgi:hypothetical protein
MTTTARVVLPLAILDDLLPLRNPLAHLARRRTDELIELLERQVDQGVLRRSGTGTFKDPFRYEWTHPAFASAWEASREAHDRGFALLLRKARERGLL